jgi:hypothetical protein
MGSHAACAADVLLVAGLQVSRPPFEPWTHHDAGAHDWGLPGAAHVGRGDVQSRKSALGGVGTRSGVGLALPAPTRLRDLEEQG